jgi:hypothetical protein
VRRSPASSSPSWALVVATLEVVSTWQLLSSSCSVTPRFSASVATALLRGAGSPVDRID